MLTRLAIENYRSLLKVVLPLGPLNLITGSNGSGKSNLYRSLRLIAETTKGGVSNALAREGGLQSTFWAGPETISRNMQSGAVPVQGSIRSKPKRLKLGFSDEDFGYSVSMGLPKPAPSSAFSLDPEIKRECIWAGESYKAGSLLVDRKGQLLRSRTERHWEDVTDSLSIFESMYSQVADPITTPLIMIMRERIRGWRFYDHFRTDSEAPARLPQLGIRTPVLHHDGRDLAAALQTIREIGDEEALIEAVEHAFPGASLNIRVDSEGHFSLAFSQNGLLRPLSGTELSDGTLRYLLWVAALLTPRPPAMMVLNEPETSLHPELLPALARLIIEASKSTQVWVVSHSKALIDALKETSDCQTLELEKNLGETQVVDQTLVTRPSWTWPD